MSHYRLGEHFAHLTEQGEFLPIEVQADFWEHGINKLPAGRLVSVIASNISWPNWEMHPHGEELIIQRSGRLMLILDDHEKTRIELAPGDFAIVPKGVWHTADVLEPGDAIYITDGKETEGRERRLIG